MCRPTTEPETQEDLRMKRRRGSGVWVQLVLAFAAACVAQLLPIVQGQDICTAQDIEHWEDDFEDAPELLDEVVDEVRASGVGVIEVEVQARFGDYTSACRDCFEDAVVAAAFTCVVACADEDPFANATVTCAECLDLSVLPDFAVCAGFELLTCIGCTDAPSTAPSLAPTQSPSARPTSAPANDTAVNKDSDGAGDDEQDESSLPMLVGIGASGGIALLLVAALAVHFARKRQMARLQQAVSYRQSMAAQQTLSFAEGNPGGLGEFAFAFEDDSVDYDADSFATIVLEQDSVNIQKPDIDPEEIM